MSDNLLIAFLLVLCLATCDSCEIERTNARQLYCPPTSVKP